MPKPKVLKIFSSIFVKLMVFILIAGLGINLAIIFLFGAVRHQVEKNYHPHLNRYINSLLKDIGEPPNFDRAQQIAAETSMVISYDGQDQTWSTSNAPIAIPLDRFHIRHRDERMQVSSYHGSFLIAVQQDKARLTFYLPHQLDTEKKIKVLGISLLLYITLLMVGAYFAIRWLLKPLRWLKHGVDQVAKGELSHRVPLKRADELRDLSASFNTMTTRLQQLIQSKEQLLLDVSHEMRSPITRIKVALALVPASAEKVSIEEDLKEMEKKITELLETARALNIKSSLTFTPVHLDELINRTVRQFTAGQPAIHIAPIPEMAPILLDEDLMAKVVKNLLDNAQKFSPDDSPPIEISLVVEKTEVLISIQDHGIGIPQEDIDFIFEPFYRVDKARTPQRDGFGLGLSMAKNIIEAHGGAIEIRSTLNAGTRVEIKLPLILTPPEKP